MEDVCLIAEEMQKNGWCPAGQMPQSVIAWDLVRLVNLGRWAYLCDYIREDEMWHIMQVAADTALERLFFMGRIRTEFHHGAWSMAWRSDRQRNSIRDSRALAEEQ